MSEAIAPHRDLLRLEPRQVRRITVRRDGAEQVIERLDDGSLRLPEGAAGVPDSEAVEDLLRAMQLIQVQEFVAENPPDLSVYGLDRPRVELVLGLTGDAGIRRTLRLGGPAKPGGVYASISGEDMVFILEEGLELLLKRSLVVAKPPSPETAPAASNPEPAADAPPAP